MSLEEEDGPPLKDNPSADIKIKTEELDSMSPASTHFPNANCTLPTGDIKAEFTMPAFAPQIAQSVETAPPAPASKPTKKRKLAGDKNAKDYWRRQYLNQQQQEDQLPSDSTASELTAWHAKRQRNAHGLTKLDEEHGLLENGALQEGTIEARAKLGDITMQTNISGKLYKNVQIQMLAKDYDRSDPQAVRDRQLLEEATLSFGHGRCKAVDGKWKLPGFKTPLYSHQLIGVRWMLGREFSPHGPTGGILADQMGLGKTIQVLACMSQNMPDKKEKSRNKTLIIAPESLQSQWYDEIEHHCSDKLHVMKYKASYGAVSQATLQKQDIM